MPRDYHRWELARDIEIQLLATTNDRFWQLERRTPQERNQCTRRWVPCRCPHRQSSERGYLVTLGERLSG